MSVEMRQSITLDLIGICINKLDLPAVREATDRLEARLGLGDPDFGAIACGTLALALIDKILSERSNLEAT